jgi:hypothetical protein
MHTLITFSSSRLGGGLKKVRLCHVLTFSGCRMLLTFCCIFDRTCRNPACDALICEESMKPVQIGAGLRLHADCTVGHKNTWDSCEFTNKTRTSVLDIMISVFQLTIGLNMSQVILACSVPACIFSGPQCSIVEL